MKLLHVVHNYAPAVGGTQWMVQQISERLVAQYDDDVTVFTTVAYNNSYFWDRHQPAMKPGTEWVHGVRVVRFPVFNGLGSLRLNIARVAHKLRLPGEDWARGLFFGPIVPSLTKAVASSGVDLVMASAFPLLHMHDALAGATQARIPCVFLGAIHPVDRWSFDRQMIYTAIHRCTSYIAYTCFEREYLTQKGVEPGKITIIGGGVDPDEYADVDGMLVRRHFNWGERPIIATIAQHVLHKRIDLLIKAMDRVWEFFPQALLLVMGSRTNYSQQLEALVRAYSPEHQKQIIFYDHCTAEEKAQLLAACDVFAMLSSHESFGLVFLEAWASGKPVIGSNVSAIPSVIEHGVDGLLVPYSNVEALAQALIRLLGDPILAKEMGAKGLEKVRTQFSWNTVVRRFRDVYIGAVQMNRERNRMKISSSTGPD
ncbi:MAG: glycosyltransferase family 4 protein [Chloroflexi bacterium]|nr:glycosyltransferase family 4 protein [Chloroflexota bacterium]